MIKSFRHKGLERLFKTGNASGVQSDHTAKLRRQLAKLAVSAKAQDMNIPGWKLHPLRGALKGHWAIWVSGNWRMTFTFEGKDAVLVDYQDYH